MFILDKMLILAQNPIETLTFLGFFIFILLFIYISKIKFTTRLVAHIGITLALTIILHFIRLYHMPQGGSVTLGGMLPIILLSLYYTPAVGYLAGFIYGFINFIQDPFILHPVQVIFDYPLPYMMLGIVGYFKKHVFLGTIIAVSARFICHFLSGIIFFGNYAPAGTSVYAYSFIFNISYLLPELILTLILLYFLPLNRIFKYL